MVNIDAVSILRAYELFNTNDIDTIEVGSTSGLQEIHYYLFSNLYKFAGNIRNFDLTKGGFSFAHHTFLEETLESIDLMPEENFEEIVLKYIEMNIAHPFMDGNGRATRIWLDAIMKTRLQKIIIWDKIEKDVYMHAISESPTDETFLLDLFRNNLSSDVNDLDLIIRGIKQSYYYEE